MDRGPGPPSSRSGKRRRLVSRESPIRPGPAPKALETETSAEVRERVKKLLDEADGDTPEWRQQRRAVEALEVIGTREARGVLESLAKGAQGARLTAEAVGAIGRMK